MATFRVELLLKAVSQTKMKEYWASSEFPLLPVFWPVQPDSTETMVTQEGLNPFILESHR